MHLPMREALARERFVKGVVSIEPSLDVRILDHSALEMEAPIADEDDRVHIGLYDGRRAAKRLTDAERPHLWHCGRGAFGDELCAELLDRLHRPGCELYRAH